MAFTGPRRRSSRVLSIAATARTADETEAGSMPEVALDAARDYRGQIRAADLAQVVDVRAVTALTEIPHF